MRVSPLPGNEKCDEVNKVGRVEEGGELVGNGGAAAGVTEWTGGK